MADTLHDVLAEIQQELKVPKDINNDFGGFKYRNLEQIEDKVKPFLKKFNLTLKFDDDIVGVGDRVYVKATATLSNGTDSVSAVAFAREASQPKAKMDDSQLTGSCSSYARKYAASGLFLIDNTEDADSYSHQDEKPTVAMKGTRDYPEKKPTLIGMATDKQRETIKDNLIKMGISLEEQPGYLVEQYGVELPLTKEGASFVIDDLFEANSYARKD